MRRVDDGGEIGCREAGAADEAAVDVGLRHERGRVRCFHASAIQETCVFQSANGLANVSHHSVRGGRLIVEAGSNGPNGLVRYHAACCGFFGEPFERRARLRENLAASFTARTPIPANFVSRATANSPPASPLP